MNVQRIYKEYIRNMIESSKCVREFLRVMYNPYKPLRILYTSLQSLRTLFKPLQRLCITRAKSLQTTRP